MKAIFKFELSCGRMGYLSGVFIADTAEVAGVIGKTIYFGEVLGKHSDISADIDDEITLLSQDPTDVETVERLGLECGINPLNYYEPEDDEEDEDE